MCCAFSWRRVRRAWTIVLDLVPNKFEFSNQFSCITKSKYYKSATFPLTGGAFLITDAVVLAYLCIVSIRTSIYLRLASVLLTPLCASQASHFSCSRMISALSPDLYSDRWGLSITPSTSPSIACLYRPYRRKRSAGGGRADPVRGIFLTVFKACTNTRSKFLTH